LSVGGRLLQIGDEGEDAVFGDGWRETSPLRQVSIEKGRQLRRVYGPID
jgi:hypothetical protein